MTGATVGHPGGIGRGGYTMVELLTATTLAVLMLIGVVTILGTVSRAVNDSRALLEMADRLRATRNLLEQDLRGITVHLLPPRRPEFNEGYFEYIEGPLGPIVPPSAFAINSATGEPDWTVTDFDDVLMFTTRRLDRPFVGRLGNTTIESSVAEVAWFVRGNVLYRRVLLVAPWASLPDADGNGVASPSELGGESIYNYCDLSARPQFINGQLVGWIPNSLGDLSNRENRYAHWITGMQLFPYDASVWGLLGLPTLEESSDPGWMSVIPDPGWAALIPKLPIPTALGAQSDPTIRADMWIDPYLWANAWAASGGALVDPKTGILLDFRGPRVGEDVVLTNVIGFDVKVWDPDAQVRMGPDGEAVYPSEPGFASAGPALGVGAFVDLGSGGGRFGGVGHPKSGLGFGSSTTARGIRVYDTWSFFYEHDGRGQLSPFGTDSGTNGFDDNGNGVVDDPDEFDTMPPYPHPLEAIQVVIRVFEPDTKQIRQVTLVHNFSPLAAIP